MAVPSISELPHDAVWFVTGCSSGIGRSIASLIASKPSLRLVATARDTDKLSFLPKTPAKILCLSLDITSRGDITVAITAAIERFGRIDVFVNNAGYYLFGDTESINEAAARKQMDTNFFGAADITLQALPVLRDINSQNHGKQGGLIIQISSSSGFIGLTGSTYYNASKFAIEGFTEGLAKEVLPDWNIRFLIVEPGGVKSQFVANMEETVRHPAYSDPSSPTNQLRGLFGSSTASYFAHPDRIAEAIFEAASQGRNFPLRLPLGSDAWGMTKTKLDEMSQDLERVKPLSFGVGNQDK